MHRLIRGTNYVVFRPNNGRGNPTTFYWSELYQIDAGEAGRPKSQGIKELEDIPELWSYLICIEPVLRYLVGHHCKRLT